MFSLIITIVTIALVAALAVTAIYYGGEAFGEGSDKAMAATVINQGEMILAAADMHRAKEAGSMPDDIQNDLVPKYLIRMPTLTSSYFDTTRNDWTIESGKVVLNDVKQSVCDEIGTKNYFECDTGTRKLTVNKESFKN